MNREVYVIRDFPYRFGYETAQVFDGINWDNIIIAGGFIHKLLTVGPIGNSDIDLFVFGSKEEVDAKIKYLLEYFQQYNPFFMIHKSLLHILIPKLNYLIQIIPRRESTPTSIINDFDFNYVSMYYDGRDVHTNLLGLIALKYNLAIRKPGYKGNNSDFRIYKTIRKGLKIKYDAGLESGSTIVNKNFIDVTSFESDQLVKMEFEKYSRMKQVFDMVPPSKHIQVIKLFFDAELVTQKITDINLANVGSFNKYVYLNGGPNKIILNKSISNIKIRKGKPFNNLITFFAHMMNKKEFIPYLEIDLTKCKSWYYSGKSKLNSSTYTLNIDLDSETSGILSHYEDKILHQVDTKEIITHTNSGMIRVHFNKDHILNPSEKILARMSLFTVDHRKETRIKYFGY